jgi:hypothetical protein
MHVPLPITARVAWLARMASLALAVLLPVFAITLGFSLGEFGERGWYVPDIKIIGLGVHTALACLLPVVLSHLPTPRLQILRIRAGYILSCIGLTIASMIYAIVTPPISIYTLLPLAGIVFAGYRIYRAMPPAFLVAPTEPEPEHRFDEAIATHERSPLTDATPGDSTSGEFLFFHKTIGRLLMNQWGIWVVLPIIVLYASIISADFTNGKAPLPYVFFVAVWFWAVLLIGTARLYKLDPLPIPRRVIFAHAMVPAFLAVVLGICIGQATRVFKDDPPRLISFRQCKLSIPYEFHEIAWDGQPPESTTSWGETFKPRAHTLYSGSRIAVYNPYDHAEDSSVRFVERQFARAMSRIHGVDAPTLIAGPGSSLNLSICEALGRGVVDTSPSVGRSSESRSKLFAAGTALLCLLGGIAIILALFAKNQKPRNWVYGIFPILVLGIIAVGIFGVAVADGLDFIEMWVAGAFLAILVRTFVDAIPVGPSAMWLIALGAALVSYIFVQWGFGKTEAPGRRAAKQFVKEM